MAATGTFEYPKARKDTEAFLSNTPEKVPNEYVWLEDPDSEETQAWVGQQNKLFDGFLEEVRQNGLFDQIQTTYRNLLNYPRQGAPSHHGEYFHFYKNDGLQNQSVLYVQKDPQAPASVYLDPNQLAEDGTASLGSTAFTEDGHFFAYGVNRKGSDWQTIHVMQSDGLVQLEDRCEFVKFSSICWTHDNKGFFYARFPKPATTGLGTETAKNEHHKIYYHVLGTPQSHDILIYERPDQPEWLFGQSITDDGKHLVITTSFSCEDVNQVHILPLEHFDHTAAPPAPGPAADGTEQYRSLAAQLAPHILPVITTFEASYSLITSEGTQFWFQSNLNSPRGKVVSVDIAKPELFDHPDSWVTILPQHEADVLSGVTVTNNNILVAMYMKDATDRIFLFGMDGTPQGEVPLPALGTLSGITARKEDSFFYFKFVSFTHPGTILRVDVGESASFTVSTHLETLVSGIDAHSFIVSQEWYPSKDGTKIPMFLVRHKTVPRDSGDAPVYLYGYGGFNISIQPSFSSMWVFWLQYFRGILAVANIRGGGEFGEEWHHAGVKDKKQNVFDDFSAAAQYLIDTGATKASKITINGGSNGGLLVGACTLQHPELFGCSIAQVGVFDMLQFHKFTIGYAWTSDYGCADNAEDFQYLIKYSPLHNVKPTKQQFPSILLLTADHDDRVVPLHTFKFGAKLQEVIGSDPDQKNPILLRIECKAGHGAGKPISKTIIENSEIFAFISKTLGLPLHGLDAAPKSE